MEFPFGHQRHHHHRNEEEEQYPPPPPPPPSQPHYYPPHIRPSPEYNNEQYPIIHHHHSPQPDFNYSVYPPEPLIYRPPPPPPHVLPPFEPQIAYPSVQHVSHEQNLGFESRPPEFRNETHHHNQHQHQHHHLHPHLPSFVHHQSHTVASELSNKPSVRVFTKAKTDFSLTIRDGHVILARANESDPFQHWIKDEKYSTRVKDEESFPSFALVNKATGQAMKHSIGATHPVQLIPYNANHLDESILWTESKDLGDSYRTIRMVNNIRLNVDAFNGDKNHGGVHDGTKIVLWEWKKGDNQRWKIIPY